MCFFQGYGGENVLLSAMLLSHRGHDRNEKFDNLKDSMQLRADVFGNSRSNKTKRRWFDSTKTPSTVFSAVRTYLNWPLCSPVESVRLTNISDQSFPRSSWIWFLSPIRVGPLLLLWITLPCPPQICRLQILLENTRTFFFPLLARWDTAQLPLLMMTTSQLLFY